MAGPGAVFQCSNFKVLGVLLMKLKLMIGAVAAAILLSACSNKEETVVETPAVEVETPPAEMTPPPEATPPVDPTAVPPPAETPPTDGAAPAPAPEQAH
jgi:PBP1b-binding outer membrane lipoprotein LpoB